MAKKWKKKDKPVAGMDDVSSHRRQGCGFTNGDLSQVVEATGFSRTQVEKDMKAAFRKAQPNGKAVSVYTGITISKGTRGKTATLNFSN